MNTATLAICIPLSRFVPPEWALSLATLSMPMNTNYSHFSIKGMKRDLAREYLVDRALSAGAKRLLFIDDDTVPPSFAVHELMYALDNSDDDVAFCAGIYCTKSLPPIPIVSMEIGGGPFWKWKTGDVFEAPFLGTGCMMIKADVFRKIPKPWFRDITTVAEAREYGLIDPEDEDTEDTMTSKFHMTDDIFFCHKLQKAGLKGLAHGGVLPIHFDQDGNPYPLPDDCYPVKHGKINPRQGFGFRWEKTSNQVEPVDTMVTTG